MPAAVPRSTLVLGFDDHPAGGLTMHHRTRSLTWQGQSFHFQCLPALGANETPLWAVSRRGEFIGTMACSSEISTRDFDVRSIGWLGELFRESPRLHLTP